MCLTPPDVTISHGGAISPNISSHTQTQSQQDIRRGTQGNLGGALYLPLADIMLYMSSPADTCQKLPGGNLLAVLSP